MKKYKVLLTFLIGISNYLFGQITPITPVGLRDFTINKFDKIVYARDNYNAIVNEYNLVTGKSKSSQFPNLPVFANKSRKAVYEKDKLLYMYDFGKDSTYFLGPAINYDPYLSFSPNDIGLLEGQNDTLKYFLFTNNSIKPQSSVQNLRYSQNPPSWVTDTTVIISDPHIEALLLYNTISGKEDTILVTPYTGRVTEIFGFDYNKKYNLIAYSYETQPNTRIHLFDMKTGKDSVAFHLESDMPNSTCADGAPLSFDYLKWASDSNKLLFFGNFATNSVAGIYTYYLDKDSTLLLSDCHDFGLKTDAEWMSNDTVIFSNQTAFRVYSLLVPKITTSIDDEDSYIPKSFIIFQNYPNPFNPLTTIEYSIPKSSFVTLKVFDILGREVATLVNEEKSLGNYKINFNGSSLSSGIYFYRLNADNFSEAKKFILMK
ncbi:T9SS type A sorting domain-containing protein [Stygiobacter electus]|uniref:T9SS type A sorting domain-containing protein n=1 Tax=Stygiobacter electus TaxID=3032292 RepID=A0AAE3P010_9BACT|nr:T9SS type A sorting domain-containing protein [Stygiobacter electus]MDF1611794.1 T9SS type A sorting domain-containing protein [Stygiobacter electus]